MIFVDASALIAIILGEPEADSFADVLEADRTRLCSAISVWEAVAGLCHGNAFSVPSARMRVRQFLDVGDFRFVSIGEKECGAAETAYARFGKGRHPAKLNMGDCFAYACTKVHKAKLLFKGDDFTKTDIAAALA